MKKRLAVTGHAAWAAAECQALCEPGQYKFSTETAVEKVRGSGSLNGNQLSALLDLAVWRDAAARQADLPARAYLKDEILVDLVRNRPKTAGQLGRIRNMPRPLIERQGPQLIEMIAAGLAKPWTGPVADRMPSRTSPRSSPPTPSGPPPRRFARARASTPPPSPAARKSANSTPPSAPVNPRPACA
ncbi:MAG: HRDC domain-containing protein [Tepidisphaeraceae bacterium]